KKYEKLAIGYTMRIYTNEQAKEYATQGFSRRLKILTRCIKNIFERIPPDQVDLPIEESLSDTIINIHAFIVNIFACIDNLAWVIVNEKNIAMGNGKSLSKIDVGLGKKNKVVRRACSSEFREHLESMDNWFEYLENYRHALAHRIPPYIPPYAVTPENEGAFKSLDARMQNASLSGDLAEHESLSAEQRKLCFFRPWLMHSFVERSNPIVFHAQIIADFNTIDELGQKMLKELNI
ncbi:MAG: hypothetical protein ACTSUY_11160, partial [Alphaproteobacteria bacterium]